MPKSSPGMRLSASAKKRLKYFLCLDYPLQVTLGDAGWRGSYVDLPGVSLVDADLQAMFQRLDDLRRMVIADAIGRGIDLPLPNSNGHAVNAPEPMQSEGSVEQSA